MASSKEKSDVKTYTDKHGRVVEVGATVMFNESGAQGRAQTNFGVVTGISYGNVYVDRGSWSGIKPHNLTVVSEKFVRLYQSGEIFVM